MRPRLRRVVGCCIVIVCGAAATSAQPPRGTVLATQSRQSDAYRQLPIGFEPNLGQTAPEVKFLARGSGFGLFLTSNEMVLRLDGRQAPSAGQPAASKGDSVRMTLVGSNPRPDLTGERPLPGITNYFFGRDPLTWRRNVPQFGGVRYRSVYPGIDLVYYGNQRQFEYDFVVAPGANPRAIRLRFSGMSSMKLNAAGDLLLTVAGREISVRAPFLYQEVDGVRRPVAGRYRVSGAGDVRFEVGAYDRSRTLVVDPTVVFSTYFGGLAAEDFPTAAALDQAGNLYVVGNTLSVDYPSTGSINDVSSGVVWQFVSKLSADGQTLVYSTLIKAGVTMSHRVAVDQSGRAHVALYRVMPDLPVVNAVQETCTSTMFGWCEAVYVFTLSPDGSSLVQATYLGGLGSSWGDWDYPQPLATDPAGNTYLVGETTDSTFPVANALQGTLMGSSDAFLVKLDPTGALVYSTFLGGAGAERAYAVAADPLGYAYVVGHTTSLDFPTLNAFQPSHGSVAQGAPEDGFALKLSPDGQSLLYSTYFGGSGYDKLSAIALDGSRGAVIAGSTASADFPTTPGRTAPAPPCNERWCAGPVVLKLDPDGQPVFSTTVWPEYRLLAVDADGNIYRAGGPGGLPAVNGLMPYSQGASLFYVEKRDPTAATVLFSTYWGGSGWCWLPDDSGRCITRETPEFLGVDSGGNIVVVGTTTSRDFPTVNALRATPGVQPPYLLGNYYDYYWNHDGFIVKISTDDNTPAGQAVPVSPVDGVTIAFDNVATAGTTSVGMGLEVCDVPPPSTNFRMGQPAVYYDISTTATYTGGVSICLDYSNVKFTVEWGLGLFHYEDGVWRDVTTSVDTTNNIVCGVATSLSPFAILGAPLPAVNVAGFAPPLAPLVAEGAPLSWPDKAFKFGRTLPLRLQLLVDGTPLTDQEVQGPKIVEVSRQGDSVLNLATLDLNTGASNDNGLVFRFSDGSWVYNLSTQGLSTGRYLITIQLWDGRRLQGGFELKR